MRSETLFQDLRFGLRMFGEVTAIAVIALALDIGATTAIFSVISAILLHPLSSASTDRLVIVYATSPRGPRPKSGTGGLFRLAAAGALVREDAGMASAPVRNDRPRPAAKCLCAPRVGWRFKPNGILTAKRRFNTRLSRS